MKANSKMARMLELVDKNFKIVIINVFKDNINITK